MRVTQYEGTEPARWRTELPTWDSLCLGEPYPGIRPPQGDFHIDILTRLGEAFRFEDLPSERVDFDGLEVSVVTPATLYRRKKLDPLVLSWLSGVVSPLAGVDHLLDARGEAEPGEADGGGAPASGGRAPTLTGRVKSVLSRGRGHRPPGSATLFPSTK